MPTLPTGDFSVSSRRRSRRRVRYGFLFLALLVVPLAAFQLRPRSLLERATLIVSLRDPHDGPDSEGSLVYRWIDDHELVLLRYPDALNVTAERLDLSTGRRTPAKDIVDLLDPVNAYPLFAPDGKWFLLDADSAEKATMNRSFYIASVIVSPQGDRVGWAFVRDHPAPLQAWLNRLFFGRRPAEERQMTLAVSNLDGAKMRLLGTFRLSITEKPLAYQAPWDTMEWAPGGKLLAFTYQDSLYTIPVD